MRSNELMRDRICSFLNMEVIFASRWCAAWLRLLFALQFSGEHSNATKSAHRGFRRIDKFLILGAYLSDNALTSHKQMGANSRLSNCELKVLFTRRFANRYIGQGVLASVETLLGWTVTTAALVGLPIASAYCLSDLLP